MPIMSPNPIVVVTNNILKHSKNALDSKVIESRSYQKEQGQPEPQRATPQRRLDLLEKTQEAEREGDTLDFPFLSDSPPSNWAKQ